MKKLIALFTTLIVLMFTANVMAVGEVEQTIMEVGRGDNKVVSVKFSCTGDASDGSIPDTDIRADILSYISGWFLDIIVVNPGSVAPTVDSDVYIDDEDEVDLLNGNGVDLLHNTAAKACVPNTDGQNKRQPIRGTVTLDVDNQSVNSATYDIILVFVQE